MHTMLVESERFISSSNLAVSPTNSGALANETNCWHFCEQAPKLTNLQRQINTVAHAVSLPSSSQRLRPAADQATDIIRAGRAGRAGHRDRWTKRTAAVGERHSKPRQLADGPAAGGYWRRAERKQDGHYLNRQVSRVLAARTRQHPPTIVRHGSL